MLAIAWQKKDRLAACQFGTSAILFSNANSLVNDENARELLAWLILGLHYFYSRVMSMSFCTRLMGQPFFPVPSLHIEYYRTP